MSKYIDADAFRDFEISRCGRMPIIGTDSSNNVPLGPELHRFPAVDLVKQVHAGWKWIPPSLLECSSCKHKTDRASDYCPYCGAKMDEA